MSTGTINVVLFEFDGSGNWKNSLPDNWNISTYELTGQEKVLGHKKIDGAICKIVQSDDNKIIALSK